MSGRPARVLRTTLLIVMALVLAEASLRLMRFGPTVAALGPWREPSRWNAIRILEPDGTPWPIPGGQARWALEACNRPIDYRLDDRGLRIGAPAVRAAGSDACRILVLGDSNAFGYGVAAEEAYPAQLEELLVGRGVPAEVENAGICGSNVRGARRWLEEILPHHRVRVVLLTVSPWSLRLDPAPGDSTPGATFTDKLWNVVSARTRQLGACSALVDRGSRRAFHTLSLLIGWPASSGVAWEMEPLLESPAEFERRWAGVTREIEQMVSFVRSQGAQALLVFVPLDVQVSTARNRLYRNEQLPYPSYGFVDRDYTHDERYAQAIAGLAARLGVRSVDLTPVLRRSGADGFLGCDYHLSRAGHRQMAAAVAGPVVATCPPGRSRPASQGPSPRGSPRSRRPASRSPPTASRSRATRPAAQRGP